MQGRSGSRANLRVNEEMLFRREFGEYTADEL